MKIRKGSTRPGVWCVPPQRAGRGGQACAYDSPGMAHGDVDMSEVHGDSAAADDEPCPASLSDIPYKSFTQPRFQWGGVPFGTP